MTTQVSQAPVMHPIDAKHVNQRNNARDRIFYSTLGATSIFGIFLMMMSMKITGSIETHSDLFWIFIGACVAFFTFFTAQSVEYFMWMKDYELTILKGIEGQLMRLNNDKE